MCLLLGYMIVSEKIKNLIKDTKEYEAYKEAESLPACVSNYVANMVKTVWNKQ